MRTILIAASLAACAAVAHAAPPPASAFGRAPQVQDASISPNGAKVAILGGAPDARQIAIATIDQAALPVLPLGDIETLSLRWVGDDYVMAEVGVLDKPRFQPRLKYRLERNVAVDANATSVKRMLDNDEASDYAVQQPVLGIAAGPPARALIYGLVVSAPSDNLNTHINRKGNDPGRPFVAALWSVDPKTGDGKLVERGDYDTISWSVDATGAARVRISVDELSHVLTIDIRRPGGGRWINVLESADEAALERYLGYSSADDAIFLREWRDGRQQIVRIKLADSSRSEVWSGPASSTANLLWDVYRGSVVGVSSGGDNPSINWLDPEIAAVHTSLGKAMKGSALQLSNWSQDRTRFVMRVSKGDEPATWRLFDRPRKELSPLGDEYPELAGVALGETKFITYKASDGLEIPALVTTPPGFKPGEKRPLIVLPHGGPSAHDASGFDYLTQFLATRGYVVLRPQYRGSTGFGAALENAGVGAWGGKMQSDLRDGVARLAADGLIDTNKVCIVGASFGGYLALSGVTLDDRTYRCAASIAGFSNIGLLLGDSTRHFGKDNVVARDLRRMWGGMTPLALAQASPVTQAARASAPILLVHAENDTIVPPQHSVDMQAALTKAGKPVQMVMLKNDDHYLMRSDTRTQMLQALETFLATNLPLTP